MTTAAVLVRSADASDQTLRAVSPGNGESVTEVPEQVTLTFAAAVPQDVSVRVLVPGDDGAGASGGGPVPVGGAVRVEGAVVTAPVPSAGPGDYTVAYTVGQLSGETGFTVLAPGQAPPQPPGGTTAGAVVSIALAVALVAVVVLTVRRWVTR